MLPDLKKNKDVEKLWKEYRICGKLVGCLPRRLHQNACLSLPLQLFPVEAKLLLDKGYAKLVEMNILSKEETDSNINDYNKFRKESFDEQRKVLKEVRVKEIEEKADKILDGKRKKLAKLKLKHCTDSEQQDICSRENGELTREAVIEEEINKITTASDDICFVQIFRACPWKNADKDCSWTYPETSREKLQYAIFSDLWEKGYYITSGSKFGGDFLVYAGNPMLYHSIYIIICTDYKKKIPVRHIPLCGQLATRVKKTLVLATLKPCGSADYLSLKWCGKWSFEPTLNILSDTDSSEIDSDWTDVEIM